MTDPEGGEVCAFLRAKCRLIGRTHGRVVDRAEPEAQARWQRRIYGVDAIDDGGWLTLEGVPGMPILTMDFVPVPEPTLATNRIHWDVTVQDVAPLAGDGATLLREPDDDIKARASEPRRKRMLRVYTVLTASRSAR